MVPNIFISIDCFWLMFNIFFSILVDDKSVSVVPQAKSNFSIFIFF